MLRSIGTMLRGTSQLRSVTGRIYFEVQFLNGQDAICEPSTPQASSSIARGAGIDRNGEGGDNQPVYAVAVE